MENFTQKREKYPESLNFLNLSEDEKFFFKKQVEESKGSIWVVIHPRFDDESEYYYVDDEGNKHTSEVPKSIVRANNVYDKLIKTESQKAAPLVVFLDPNDQKTIQYTNHEKKRLIYTLETGEDTPVPFDYLENEKEGWDTIAKNFIDVGVKYITLAGQYLGVEEELKTGCVGAFAENIKNAFNRQGSEIQITFSQGTHPDRYSHENQRIKD